MQFITKMSEDEPGDTPQEQTGSKNEKMGSYNINRSNFVLLWNDENINR